MRTDQAAAILIDWGTTNLRAFRLGRDGAVRERRQAPRGILHVPERDFARALRDLVGDWRAAAPTCPVLMAGMIGSRQGWVEAPYVPCPAGPADLARHIVEVPGAPGVRVTPGVSFAAVDGRHDVMRGEETQIFGALAGAGTGRRVLCLPGTHSKWAVVEDGQIVWFATAMTGEVYAVLQAHSILGALMTGDAQDSSAFRRGLDRSGQDGGLLHHLFGVRAQGLVGAIPATGLRSYLSGILVGHEVAAMIALTRPETVVLVGAPALCALYAEALLRHGCASDTVDGEHATVAGLSLLLATAAADRTG
ncbi:MAG TPA: 2-dehydro-3-deoxygalactonokinase [Dongiaceae bacterium]|nr:2-dehydro-3-deoxygalactonokinase [Dongiaceae bacterium]